MVEREERNIAIICTYDGTAYSGLQVQENARTIQGELEKALRELFSISINVHACSRTDAGVHALGLVANFKLANKIPCEKIPLAFNSRLPAGIKVIKALEMPFDFHARFDCIGKSYIYKMQVSNAANACDERYTAFVPKSEFTLNLAKIKEAMFFLLGKKDFKAFQAAGSDLKGTTVRRIDRLCLTLKPLFPHLYNYMNIESSYTILDARLLADEKKENYVKQSDLLASLALKNININDEYMSFIEDIIPEGLFNTPYQLELEVHGDGFLYNMVRILAGTLLYVGENRLSIDTLIEAVEEKNRINLGKTMPAKGLFLKKVDYLNNYENLLYN